MKIIIVCIDKAPILNSIILFKHGLQQGNHLGKEFLALGNVNCRQALI